MPLAPLHNPANLLGIAVCAEQLPNLPQVAVFDTAFHQTMPDYAYLYATPRSWERDHHVRRYGFRHQPPLHHAKPLNCFGKTLVRSEHHQRPLGQWFERCRRGGW